MENKVFKIAGIKNLMKKNYDVAADLIDIESEIDDRLSMADNWFKIKDKVMLLCEKEHKILFE